MSEINVGEIVMEYLRANGYDGLVDESSDCACELDDSEPCCYMTSACQPGHKVPCDCSDHDPHDHDFHMLAGKRPSAGGEG